MEYRIYKLKFITPVRFPSINNKGVLYSSDLTAPASVLFSSLYITTLELNKIELKIYLEESDFLLSDLLPYKHNNLYIPKPIMQHYVNKDVDAKKIKQLQYIDLKSLNDYFNDPMKIIEQEEFNNFGYFSEEVKVSKIEPESMPFSIEVFHFYEGYGLYFITNIPQHLENDFLITLKMLGLTGIGGKKTSGYGKFEVEKVEDLKIINELINKKGSYYMTLSSFIPLKEELKEVSEGTYLLNIKNGFTYSFSTRNSSVKKENKLMIQKGSCFKEKLKGKIYKEEGPSHLIYTYGKAVMIGFDINE